MHQNTTVKKNHLYGIVLVTSIQHLQQENADNWRLNFKILETQFWSPCLPTFLSDRMQSQE